MTSTSFHCITPEVKCSDQEEIGGTVGVKSQILVRECTSRQSSRSVLGHVIYQGAGKRSFLRILLFGHGRPVSAQNRQGSPLLCRYLVLNDI